MTRQIRLQHEALETCKARGHNMKQFCHLHRYTWYAYCRNCNRQVVVCAYPQSNETEISGGAVALNCER